jgi:hypothetical protein
MRFVAVASVLLLAVSPIRAEQPQTVLAQTVFAQYIAWRGGYAFESMQSVYERGETTTGSLKGHYEDWQLRDGSERRNEHYGILRTAQATTPSSGWTTNLSGQTEDLSAEDAESGRRSVWLSFGNVIRQHGAHYTLLGTEEREGRSWYVLRIAFDGPDTYDLFIAFGTGELLGARIIEDSQTCFVRFSDWRMVDAVRMPFSAQTTRDNTADLIQRDRAQRISLNVRTSDALFARPEDRKIWSFSHGKDSTGWIDVDFFQGERLFLPGSVSGGRVEVMLDSGAGITAVDSHFARAIHLWQRGSLVFTGLGGAQAGQLSYPFRVGIGDLSLHLEAAGILDLLPTAHLVGHQLQVLLGNEAFNQLVVDIDFPHHRIAFRDPSSFSAPPQATRIALGRHRDRRTVLLSIEGQSPASFDFDLGNDSALTFFASYRDSQHLLDGRRQSQQLAGGIGGMSREPIATIRTVSIAGTELHDVPSLFPEPVTDTVRSDQTAGFVGLPVFSRFHLIVDYPHDALWLIADPAALAQPFRKERSGLVLGQTVADRARVMMVAPGSPAALDGWKEGDEIIAIDGQKIDAGFGASARWRWSERPAGTVVTLTLSDGTSRQLTLADYF